MPAPAIRRAACPGTSHRAVPRASRYACGPVLPRQPWSGGVDLGDADLGGDGAVRVRVELGTVDDLAVGGGQQDWCGDLGPLVRAASHGTVLAFQGRLPLVRSVLHKVAGVSTRGQPYGEFLGVGDVIQRPLVLPGAAAGQPVRVAEGPGADRG